jgi:hypothetical protein
MLIVDLQTTCWCVADNNEFADLGPEGNSKFGVITILR